MPKTKTLIKYADFFTDANVTATLMFIPTTNLHDGVTDFTPVLFLHTYPVRYKILKNVPYVSKYYYTETLYSAKKHLNILMPAHEPYHTIMLYGEHGSKFVKRPDLQYYELKVLDNTVLNFPEFEKLLKRYESTQLLQTLSTSINDQIKRFNKLLQRLDMGLAVTLNCQPSLEAQAAKVASEKRAKELAEQQKIREIELARKRSKKLEQQELSRKKYQASTKT